MAVTLKYLQFKTLSGTTLDMSRLSDARNMKKKILREKIFGENKIFTYVYNYLYFKM